MYMSPWPRLRIRRLEKVKFGWENLTVLQCTGCQVWHHHSCGGPEMGVSCLRGGKPEVLLLFLILWPYVCISLLISRKLGIVIKENHYIFKNNKKNPQFIGLYGNSFSTLLPNWSAMTLITHIPGNIEHLLLSSYIS